MDSNQDQPSSDNTEVDRHHFPFAQTPLNSDIDQLTSIKPDPHSAPTPGSSISPQSTNEKPPLPFENAASPAQPVAQTSQSEQIPTPLPQPAVQEAQPSMPSPGVEPTIPPQPSPLPGVNPTANGSTTDFKPKRRRVQIHLNKTVLIVLVILLILGGGLAAAYAMVIVPNKPENVLKQAFLNSIEEQSGSFNGTLNKGTTGSSGIAYKSSIQGELNRTSKTADLSINSTISGVGLAAEGRIVNGNVYYKLTNLSEITSLLGSLSPSDSGIFNSISSELANKWFVIDSTLLDESSAHCFLDVNWNFTKSDVNFLENLYKSYPFMHINSTTSTTLNGQSVDEFSISVSNEKANKFVSGLGGLSLINQANKCSKTGVNSSDGALSPPKTGTTPLSIWVNKSTKQIVRVALQDSSNGSGINFGANISYKPVSITAPANAEPVLQLLSNIQSQLEKSGAISPNSQIFSGLTQ